MRYLLTLLVALPALLCAAADAAAEKPRPNVLLIMADDLAYGDLSCYGSERQKTPRLDALAKQGLKLTNFHAASSVCSPSRMGLLSGSYPARLGWTGGVVGYLMPKGKGMSRDVYTIAEAFKDAGYRTAMSGKWHVGMRDLGPTYQGFDSSYYILNSNNMSRDMFRDDQLIHENYDNRLLSETFTEEVIAQINREADEPFFIYVPFSAPHFPADAHPDWENHSANEAYGDVVEEMDHRIGQILDALNAKNLDQQTIVIFLSDNGPEGGQRKWASAGPLKGGKWSSYEGGTRVPCIVRWPGAIPANTTSHALSSAVDLYPTLAAMCDVEINLPEDAQKIDGINVWKSWQGDDSDHPRDELLYWHGQGKPTAIQKDRWKLFFDAQNGDPDLSDGPVLFNLAEDDGETTDVSDDHPQIVEQLQKLAEQKLADIEKNSIPLGDMDSE